MTAGPDSDGRAASLAAEAQRRLGPAPGPGAPSPRISVVVVNRDGAVHLRRLLAGLAERTDYPELELIAVDNGSADESVELLKSAQTPFPIAIIANHHNESFSDACNQGAATASGELLLFLNNDAEPFEPGWLRELLACLWAHDAGIAGATLLEPAAESTHGYLVQQRAMRLRDEGGQLRADLHGRGDEPLGAGLGEDFATPIAAGACMLMRRDAFERAGGFTHGYVYGDEDVDLGWKVLDLGLPVLCSGRSLLIHRLGSTRAREDEAGLRARRAANRRLLAERWGARVRREYELDRLGGGGFWAAPDDAEDAAPGARGRALAPAFWLKTDRPGRSPAADRRLESLRAELDRRGNRYEVVNGEPIAGVAGLDCDVAVHLRSGARWAPKPAQLNVLWPLPEAGEVTPVERGRYDLALACDAAVGDAIEAVLAHAERRGLSRRFPPHSRNPAQSPCAP